MIKHGNIYILFARCLWSSVCTVFEAHLVKHREKAEKKRKISNPHATSNDVIIYNKSFLTSMRKTITVFMKKNLT